MEDQPWEALQERLGEFGLKYTPKTQDPLAIHAVSDLMNNAVLRVGKQYDARTAIDAIVLFAAATLVVALDEGNISVRG